MELHTLSRKRKLAIVLTAVAIVLVVGGCTAYILRAWLRNTVGTAYVDAMYKPAIYKAFDTDFGDVSKKLAAFGFKFDTKDVYGVGGAGCGVFGYEGFSVSYDCVKTKYSNTPALTDEYVAHWDAQSPALERYLLQNGWTKVWNDRQPIDDIFNPQHNDGSVGVNYEKSHGKIRCTLSLMRIGAPTLAQDHFYASEICERFVDVFGGY